MDRHEVTSLGVYDCSLDANTASLVGWEVRHLSELAVTLITQDEQLTVVIYKVGANDSVTWAETNASHTAS
jgi:hypothetical protein